LDDASTRGQREPVGCEVDDRFALKLLAHLAVWLAHSVLAGHRPPSAWLDRGVHSFLKLRLPAAVPTVGARRQEAHVITIGVDPHKSSHTAVAVEETGRVLGERRVPADKATLRRLRRWAEHWPERTWAVEGANGLGHLLAQQLVAAGEVVVDVPAMLAARARQLDRGHGRKTDGIDAQTVAAVAQRRSDLRRVAREDHAVVLRLLSDRRDELTAERRRVVNRLHRLLRDLRPGGAPIELSAATAARMLATIRPQSAPELERKAMARQLVADLRRLDRALADNRRRCTAAVAACGTSLTSVFGISGVLAAKILGHTGDIARFGTADRFASYTGTAPVAVSSGELTRHRLARSGNRSLNNALHLAARVQIMHPGPGRDHYTRKLAEHKSSTEALRSLKRQLAKVVYRHMIADRARRLEPLLT
jgi:transposase